MKSVKIRLLAVTLAVAFLTCIMTLGALADTSMLSPEDGMVSDRGTDSALTPEAGTVQGGDGTSIMDGVSGAVDDVSEDVSDIVSDVLGGNDTNTGNGTVSGTATDNSGTADQDGSSVAVTVIIFIIIAIAIVALVLVLVPKRRD